MSFEECFKEFSFPDIPPIIYTDTSFFVRALIDGQKYHRESVDFIDRLALASTQPIIVFSELLKIELRCAVICTCLKNERGEDISVRHELFRDPDCIQKYYPQAEEAEKRLLDILQRFKKWTCMPISSEITQKANIIMPKYRLGSQDALHIATMEHWGVKDIVVFDWGIEDLPMYKGECYIWTCDGWGRYKKRVEERSRFKEVLKRERDAVRQAQEIVDKEESDKDKIADLG